MHDRYGPALLFHERFRDRISLVTRTGAHIRVRSEGAQLVRAAPEPAPPPRPVRKPRLAAARRPSESAHSAPPAPAAPQRPKYKPYSLQDYRQLPDRVVLGRLGPDLDSDELAAKRLVSYRMQEFSRSRRLINLNNIRQARDRATVRHQTPPPPKAKATSARQRALEFAARVPRPRRFPPDGPGRKQPSAHGPEAVLDEIDQLTRQHERHKSQVDAIRKEMRLINIDNGR